MVDFNFLNNSYILLNNNNIFLNNDCIFCDRQIHTASKKKKYCILCWRVHLQCTRHKVLG